MFCGIVDEYLFWFYGSELVLNVSNISGKMYQDVTLQKSLESLVDLVDLLGVPAALLIGSPI